MRRLFFAVSLTLGACSDNTPGCPDGSSCTDAAPDVVVPFANFLVSVPSVVIDPGDAPHPVVVTLDHNGSGPIDVTVEGLPTGVTVSPLTILVGSPGGALKLTADASATVPQDVDVTIRATAAGAPSLTAPLHIRVGSVFHVATTSESFQVPSNLAAIELRVWGAGGGAGSGAGGLGGGGGFATTQISVTGGETLDVVVGGGGPAGSGGGYSAVLRGTTVLLIAGGGGGGGGGAPGYGGGGGGGNLGETGGGPCGGFGGSDAGGGAAGGANAEAGASLFGGGGALPNGGGGGVGYFGGGGGGVQDASVGFGCGGGGGSAFATALGSSSKLLAAVGQIPAGITVVGYGDSGVAMGGGLGDAGQPSPGAAGLVVVAYPK